MRMTQILNKFDCDLIDYGSMSEKCLPGHFWRKADFQ